MQEKSMALPRDLTEAAESIEESLREIWDGKQIGQIYDMYRHNAQLHTPDGPLYGREEIIRSVTLRLAAFPDLSYFVDDVICARGAADTLKLAVRWRMKGRNTGHTVYGPPTGREAALYGISHLRVMGGWVVEQWEVDNELDLVRQLGFAASDLAAELAPRGAFGGEPWGEAQRLMGQKAPEVLPPRTTTGFDIDDFVRRNRHEIWNWRLLRTIDETYREDAVFHGPSQDSPSDREGFKGFVLLLLAAFPDLAMFVDDILWSDDGEGSYRVSCRWTLLGTYRGPGPYGPPSGRRVRVSGITNDVVEKGQIVEEWNEMGEFALIKQTYAPARGPTEGPEAMAASENTNDSDQDTVTGDGTGNGHTG
jgi:predicted ester cyclase